MSEYVERATAIYRTLRASDDVDQRDVATLTTAVLQEEAKDRRMEFIDKKKDHRTQQIRLGGTDETQATTASETGTESASTGGWRTDPATEAQKKALENLGVSFEDDITKGRASDLIDEARAQQQAEA